MRRTAILFIGGPLDGQTQELEEEPDDGAVIYWPPDAAPGRHDDDVPGDDGVVEYVVRGGTAQYVGGLPPPDREA